jgi:hypothetical protein
MQDSVFDYPGWTVLIDDHEIPTSPALESGQITFNVPAGTHNVSVELRPTPIRRLSSYISLASAVATALIVMFVLFAARNRTKPVEQSVPERAAKSGSQRSRR